jgi:hypothetical protein
MKRCAKNKIAAWQRCLLLIALLAVFCGSSFAADETPGPNAAGTEDEQSAVVRGQHLQVKPLPLSNKIAIVAGGLVVAAGAFVLSLRAWRASNLFDRQYRFPRVAAPALRLGGKRSGGCMAAISFEQPPRSAAEDA